MDLLIHLIRKNEVDIYDIPISLITDQYLAYIQLMTSLNIDLAGDFLVMAATLTQIKSKMLLPVHEGEEEEEDPRHEITKPLLEYLQMKAAAEKLAERHLLGEDTFIRRLRKEEFIDNPDEVVINVGLFELIEAFQKILGKISDDEAVDFTADRVSVRERINELADILEVKGSVTFEELFSSEYNKSEIVVTFLAILEMIKLSLVRVVQHIQTGIIRLFYL
ncbi:segregation and condensation protein A [Thermodesulfobacteriota bacterium]